MKSIQEIARQPLSNGDTVRVTKYNRKYTVTTIHLEDSPPDCETDLNKAQALNRLAELIRNDVLEVELVHKGSTLFNGLLVVIIRADLSAGFSARA